MKNKKEIKAIDPEELRKFEIRAKIREMRSKVEAEKKLIN